MLNITYCTQAHLSYWDCRQSIFYSIFSHGHYIFSHGHYNLLGMILVICQETHSRKNKEYNWFISMYKCQEQQKQSNTCQWWIKPKCMYKLFWGKPENEIISKNITRPKNAYR